MSTRLDDLGAAAIVLGIVGGLAELGLLLGWAAGLGVLWVALIAWGATAIRASRRSS